MDHLMAPESKTLDQTPPVLPAPDTTVSELRPKSARILLGKGLGALVSAAGAVALVGVFCTGIHPLWSLLGLGLLLAGGGVYWLMGRLATLRILVSPNGFTIATLGQGNSCRCYRIGPPEPLHDLQHPGTRLPPPGQSRLWE
jgi:hypothetical protein